MYIAVWIPTPTQSSHLWKSRENIGYFTLQHDFTIYTSNFHKYDAAG